MPPEQENDVKSEVASSVASTSEGAASTTDVNKADSSGQQKPLQTLGDFLKDKFASKDEEKEVEKTSEKEEGEQKTVDEKATTEEKKEDDKGPVPYDRFAEVNKAKNEAEEQVAALKGKADAQDQVIAFCTEAGISGSEFEWLLNLGKAIKTDPASAWKQLSPIVERLQTFQGERLPADLQAAVDSGEMTLPMAKRLAAAEGQQQFSTARRAEEQKLQAQRSQEATAAQVKQTFNSWLESKQKLIPEFRKKGEANSPDGMFELFMAKLAADPKLDAMKQPNEIVAIADAALEAIQRSIGTFVPKPKGQKTLSSTQGTRADRQQPKTLAEAVKMAAAKHGL